LQTTCKHSFAKTRLGINKFKLNAALSKENKPVWQARQQTRVDINKLGLNGALSKEWRIPASTRLHTLWLQPDRSTRHHQHHAPLHIRRPIYLTECTPLKGRDPTSTFWCCSPLKGRDPKIPTCTKKGALCPNCRASGVEAPNVDRKAGLETGPRLSRITHLDVAMLFGQGREIRHGWLTSWYDKKNKQRRSYCHVTASAQVHTLSVNFKFSNMLW